MLDKILQDNYLKSVIRGFGSQSDPFSDLLDARSLVGALHDIADNARGRHELLRAYAHLEVAIQLELA